jgi:hypothetical protein
MVVWHIGKGTKHHVWFQDIDSIFYLMDISTKVFSIAFEMWDFVLVQV